MKKTVLFVNYGGPSANREGAIRYLKNLFSDGVVFPLPKPLRWLLANLVARARWKESVEILKRIGGESPLLSQSGEQAKELQRRLGEDYAVKVAMRYSPPFVGEVLRDTTGEVILLPAFPHYSFATWRTIEEEVKRQLGGRKLKVVKPFYDCDGFITGWVEEIEGHLKGLKNPLLLFSAHSLPLYLVRRGDPYPKQVLESARLIAKKLGLPFEVSYQSKLGPIRWLEPSTEEVLKKLPSRGVEEVVVVPVSFTAENSETLYEIDVYYKGLAREAGIKRFVRVPVPYKSHRWMDCFEHLIKNL